MGVALSEEANVLISILGFSDTSKARRFGAKSQKIKGKSVWEAKFSRGAPAPRTPSHRLVEGRCAALRIRTATLAVTIIPVSLAGEVGLAVGCHKS